MVGCGQNKSWEECGLTGTQTSAASTHFLSKSLPATLVSERAYYSAEAITERAAKIKDLPVTILER
jgi:hypothetical protein